MRRILLVLLILTAFLPACSSRTNPPGPARLYAVRLSPPALLRFSPDLKAVEAETPLSQPPDCALWSVNAAPQGRYLAVELNCPSGPALTLLDAKSGKTRPLAAESGGTGHFLAWAPDGGVFYARVDSLGDARIMQVRAATGKLSQVPLTGLTYDLAPAPDGKSFTFSFTRGLGFGSELWLARDGGRSTTLLLSWPEQIVTFARWSPDGSRIAFILMPDSQTPFPPGELWLMNADGSGARFLAPADAGHGYAPAWSPDGTQIAFVGRENPDAPSVTQSAGNLVSNLYVVDVGTNALTPITQFEGALVEAPMWSPDGGYLVFNARLDGKMDLWAVEGSRGEPFRLAEDSSLCCPVWVRK
jgi:Tol biopolymer transport system component